MVTLRCTAKLLARLGLERRPPEPPPPTTALGDWYANIIYRRPLHLVICVSERSLLPVVLAARDLPSLVPRFLSSLQELLTVIGVPEEPVQHELNLMSQFAFAATANRRVLGSLNEFVRILKYMLPLEPDFTPYDWSRYMAATPCLNLSAVFPSAATLQLLSPRNSLSIINGGKA